MIQFPSPTRSETGRGLVPFITQRAGEEAAPANLHILRELRGGYRLFYGDEDVRDRPLRGLLWARCSFTHDEHGMPTGEPQWKMMHPYRQMLTMLAGRCQICTRPAKTPLGYVYMAGPGDEDPSQESILTNQPPVCARHVRTVQALCPHMQGEPLVILTSSAPMHGVMGTVYGMDQGGGVVPVASPKEPLRFDDVRAPLMLASQLVRRLSQFRVMTVAELLDELDAVEGEP
ncbi:hypothetical protein ACH46L_03290 [Streptomyces althioticus]|uniref:hypothetical protein n=1 Tax=Streptomyces althioticus TaxID=83380 RepID=UPI00379C5EA7